MSYIHLVNLCMYAQQGYVFGCVCLCTCINKKKTTVLILVPCHLKYLAECSNTACSSSLTASRVVCYIQQAVQMEQLKVQASGSTIFPCFIGSAHQATIASCSQGLGWAQNFKASCFSKCVTSQFLTSCSYMYAFVRLLMLDSTCSAERQQP